MPWSVMLVVYTVGRWQSIRVLISSYKTLMVSAVMCSVPRSSRISRSASLQASSQLSSLSRSKCSRPSCAASAALLVYKTS